MIQLGAIGAVRSLGYLTVLSITSLLVVCGENQVTTQAEAIQVSLLIQVEETDTHWFRDVSIPNGTDAYELTELVVEGDVEAIYYPQYRSHFVDSIFGIANEAPKYWLAWVWSKAESKWEPLPVGADHYSLKEGHVLAWYFAEPSLEGNPPPVTP